MEHRFIRPHYDDGGCSGGEKMELLVDKIFLERDGILRPLRFDPDDLGAFLSIRDRTIMPKWVHMVFEKDCKKLNVKKLPSAFGGTISLPTAYCFYSERSMDDWLDSKKIGGTHLLKTRDKLKRMDGFLKGLNDEQKDFVLGMQNKAMAYHTNKHRIHSLLREGTIGGNKDDIKLLKKIFHYKPKPNCYNIYFNQFFSPRPENREAAEDEWAEVTDFAGYENLANFYRPSDTTGPDHWSNAIRSVEIFTSTVVRLCENIGFAPRELCLYGPPGCPDLTFGNAGGPLDFDKKAQSIQSLQIA